MQCFESIVQHKLNTYAKHISEIGISEPEGYVGDV